MYVDALPSRKWSLSPLLSMSCAFQQIENNKNFTVEKRGRHCVNHVIKVNITSDKMCGYDAPCPDIM